MQTCWSWVAVRSCGSAGWSDRGLRCSGATLVCEAPKADVMREYLKFFIDSGWVEPAQLATLDVENPATELVVGRIALGSAADVDRAVKAARAAFAAWSLTTREERLDVLNRIVTEYEKRFGDLMTAVTEEMGAPASLCQDAQVPAGLDHLIDATRILQDFPFQEVRGQTMIVREPIGVCGFITPLELATESNHPQGGASTRHGLHDGVEAL